MSNKRPPLLSDHDLMEMMFVTEDGKRPSEKIREFYEDLITDGKLRVVEEVQSYLENEIAFGCPSCESVWDKQARWSKNGKIRTTHYCPGCGVKIKR